MRRLILGAVLLLLVGALLSAALVRHGIESLDRPLALTAPLRFKVLPGARFSQVANELSARGVVTQPRAWIVYARWKGAASAIKAGEYEIEPGTTPRRLLDKMVSGQVVLHSLTIVDGWRLQDVLAAMQRNPDIVATLPARPAHLMDLLGFPGENPEGQFLPETYRFPTGTSDVELLREAHLALVRVLDAAWASRDPALPLKSSQELLIMASIVQRESGIAEELPRIAGLYLHRLGIGMRLQADPTVIYGLGEAYDGSLHGVDLHTDGPYNTYTRAGLPPGPISLPAAAVIKATAHPEKTDAVYFVASGNADGTHVFSVTLDQQNAAVAQYLARSRQKTAGSSR